MFELRLNRLVLPLQFELKKDWSFCRPVRIITLSFLCFHWTIFIV